MGYGIIIIFFILFLLGFEVSLAILIPSLIYVLLNDIPIDILAQRVHYALDSYPLLAVPIFIFVGNLMNSSGIPSIFFITFPASST